MNGIIRTESTAEVFGIPGRRFAVVAADNGRILNQKIGASVRDGAGGIVSVRMRFDDQCNNGHETFSITGTYRTADDIKRRREGCGGCIHEEIARFFPSLAHLLHWHLVSTDGPMHYPGNVLYLAGVRDYSGRAKGEPSSWDRVIRFRGSPIGHTIGKALAGYLAEHSRPAGGAASDQLTISRALTIEPVAHDDRPGETFKFGPKFTFEGLPCRWSGCPFDSEKEATEFRAALRLGFMICSEPVAWSEGKERELAGARSCAVWPEATDEQLSADTDELSAVLMARLPALMDNFRADMESVGFMWPVRTDAAVTL